MDSEPRASGGREAQKEVTIRECLLSRATPQPLAALDRGATIAVLLCVVELASYEAARDIGPRSDNPRKIAVLTTDGQALGAAGLSHLWCSQ